MRRVLAMPLQLILLLQSIRRVNSVTISLACVLRRHNTTCGSHFIIDFSCHIEFESRLVVATALYINTCSNFALLYRVFIIFSSKEFFLRPVLFLL